MEDQICVAIHPRGSETRVLATAGAGSTLLKARLAARPWHQRALPSLLEALALWQSRPVHAVLVVDKGDATFATSLCPDLGGMPTPGGTADGGTLLSFRPGVRAAACVCQPALQAAADDTACIGELTRPERSLDCSVGGGWAT